MNEYKFYDEMEHFVVKVFRAGDKDFVDQVNNAMPKGYVLVKSTLVPEMENSKYICVYTNNETVFVKNGATHDFGTVFEDAFRLVK